jgi:hypothetical protein
MNATVIYTPKTRYTDKTPAVSPLVVPFLRAAAVMGVEWTTLDYIEEAPVSVRVATFVIALAILAVIQRKEWLDFKGRYYFRGFLAALIAVYCGIVGFAYFHSWVPLPAPVVQAAVPKPIYAKLPPPVPLTEDERQFRFALRNFVLADVQDVNNSFGYLLGGASNVSVQGWAQSEKMNALSNLFNEIVRGIYSPMYQKLYDEVRGKTIENLDVPKTEKLLAAYFTEYRNMYGYLREFLMVSGADPNKDNLLRNWLVADATALHDFHDLRASPVSGGLVGFDDGNFPTRNGAFSAYLSPAPKGR